MPQIAYKAHFMDIISIIFITCRPHPRCKGSLLKRKSFLLEIFILFFYFPFFVVVFSFKLVAYTTILFLP